MNKKISSEFEIAPLRSLDDFLLESARFQVPNVKDMEKWGNRVINNLLYYQTNYFLLSILIFLIVGVIHPIKMACGIVVVGTAFLIFVYVTNERRTAAKFKKDHPILGIILILSGGYFITYMLGSLLVFFFGILLPFSVTFIHASLRLRNIKNKLVNKMEGIGLKRTPMGIFLEELGVAMFHNVTPGQYYSKSRTVIGHKQFQNTGLTKDLPLKDIKFPFVKLLEGKR